MKCQWQFEDLAPTNVAVINPCFRHQFNWTTLEGGTDGQQLVDDLAAALSPFTVPATKKITVTAYDLEGPKPHPPKWTKTVGTAPTPLQGLPQQALALSYYTGTNVPRKRGRLYIPAWVTTTSSAELAAARASSTIRTKVGALVPVFANLGGSNVDWIVWSRVANAAGRIDNWWVDESWDIIRRRKLAAGSSGRTTGTTSG